MVEYRIFFISSISINVGAIMVGNIHDWNTQNKKMQYLRKSIKVALKVFKLLKLSNESYYLWKILTYCEKFYKRKLEINNFNK